VGWFRRRADRPTENLVDTAERLTTRSRRQIDQDRATLSDYATVQGWLRVLGRQGDQQVFIHRPWGTVVAVAERRYDTIGVFLSDGDQVWYATPPGAASNIELTPSQVEHILLEALTSPGPPEWPDWHDL
jgi:hypothetical protein